MDDEPIWDYEHGRWLCANTSIAYTCMKQHEGDTIYTYERDHNGHMINLRLFYSTYVPEKQKWTTIRNGRLH